MDNVIPSSLPNAFLDALKYRVLLVSTYLSNVVGFFSLAYHFDDYVIVRKVLLVISHMKETLDCIFKKQLQQELCCHSSEVDYAC